MLFFNSSPSIEGNNKKIFEKLRKLEFFYISTVLNIERIRINILNRKADNIASFLFSYLRNNSEVFIINKNQRKIKKEKLMTLLQNKELKKVLEIVHFPSNILLKAGEESLNKEDMECLKEITKDEKNAIEIITAMHYPIVLDAVSSKIRQNAFFIKYEKDLVNEGFLGIFESIYKFDISKDNKFITYATPWVNYRINQFTKKILKDIDLRNGNHRKHLFKDKVFRRDSCKEGFKDFKEKIYDYDSYLPLAYLFPKLKFENLNTLKSNLNMILNNYSYTKRIINYCKRNNYFSDIITEYLNRPEIAVRIIMEKAFPYVVKIKTTFLNEVEEEFENNQHYSLKDETPDINHEKEDMLALILKEASKEEREKIEKFLNEEITLKKIEPVIKTIKEKLKKKGILD